MQLENRQIQKQTLRPQMVQSMQILQLNTTQLQEYLENLSLENPLMEFIQPTAQSYESRRETPRPADEQNWKYSQQERISAQDPWNSQAAAEETLSQSLLQQLASLRLKGKSRRILEYMIHNLDANGYLTASLQDIRTVFGCDESSVRSRYISC